MVNGWRLFARENTWGSGFNDEGMECDSVEDRCVGGSYLKSVRIGLPSHEKVAHAHVPDTHDEYFESLYRDWEVLEKLCKSEEATTIASCTFRKNNNGSICRTSDLFKAGIIATRCVQRSSSGTHDNL